MSLESEIKGLDIYGVMSNTNIIKMNEVVSKCVKLHKENKLSSELTSLLSSLSNKGEHCFSYKSGKLDDITITIGYLSYYPESMFYKWDVCEELYHGFKYFQNTEKIITWETLKEIYSGNYLNVINFICEFI